MPSCLCPRSIGIPFLLFAFYSKCKKASFSYQSCLYMQILYRHSLFSIGILGYQVPFSARSEVCHGGSGTTHSRAPYLMHVSQQAVYMCTDFGHGPLNQSFPLLGKGSCVTIFSPLSYVLCEPSLTIACFCLYATACYLFIMLLVCFSLSPKSYRCPSRSSIYVHVLCSQTWVFFCY